MSRPRAEDVAYVDGLPEARVRLYEEMLVPRALCQKPASTARRMREIDEWIDHAIFDGTVAPTFVTGELPSHPDHGKVPQRRVGTDVHSALWSFAVLQRMLEDGGQLEFVLAESWSSVVPEHARGRGFGLTANGRTVRASIHLQAVVSTTRGLRVVLLRAVPLPIEVMVDVVSVGLRVTSEGLQIVDELRGCPGFGDVPADLPLVLPGFRATRLHGIGPAYGVPEFAGRLPRFTDLLRRYWDEIPVVLSNGPRSDAVSQDAKPLVASGLDGALLLESSTVSGATQVTVARMTGAMPTYLTSLAAGDRLARVIGLLDGVASAEEIHRQRRHVAKLLECNVLRAGAAAGHDRFAALVAAHAVGGHAE